jgi:hypothetical protein
MAESATPAGREPPPEEGIQSEPKPVPPGRPSDLRDGITRHPELADLRSQQAQQERADPPGSPAPGSEAPKPTSGLGQASLILGAVAICSIGFGVLHAFTGARSLDTFLVVAGSICFGSILTVPGMVLGLASLAQKGRSNSPGEVGCWINGLILGVWLLLFAVGLIGRGQPAHRDPPEAPNWTPYDASDFFRR